MTEKPVQYVTKITPATCRHARLGAPDACLAQLHRAALDGPSLAERGWTPTTAHERHAARASVLSYERLDPRDPTDLGDRITTAVREIAREKPDLKDVIDVSDYNATAAGQRILPDGQLAGLIEILSRDRLGLRDVDPDF